MSEDKTSGAIPLSELDRVIPAPRKLPKHFRDLFVDKTTHRISPGIVWRNHRKGWKRGFRKPIRDVMTNYGPLSMIGAMRAYAPHVWEIPESAKDKDDRSSQICVLVGFLEQNTTQPWFYWWRETSHIVLFESLSDAVACRLMWKAR